MLLKIVILFSPVTQISHQLTCTHPKTQRKHAVLRLNMILPMPPQTRCLKLKMPSKSRRPLHKTVQISKKVHKKTLPLPTTQNSERRVLQKLLYKVFPGSKMVHLHIPIIRNNQTMALQELPPPPPSISRTGRAMPPHQHHPLLHLHCPTMASQKARSNLLQNSKFTRLETYPRLVHR